ncbi:MAG TPA: transglycosylase domain-containing protein [Candidatus Limnocylindria bacterium]|nr:transglycosylase domain-containing protein [Candidatus Limnocylindria bacterium]
MSDNTRIPGRRRSGGRGRKSKNTFTTRTGQTIKVNRSLTDKIRAKKDAYARARAKRLAGMPKSRIKRFFYRLHPKRMYKYWFSREGGIMALKLTGIGLIAGFLLLVGLFAYFRKDLPNLRDISGQNIGGSIRYYDRTGKTLLWEDFEAVKRIPVQDKEISEHIKKATIAIEDKDFFHHGGFDTRGIMRAAINNFTGGSTQGASTITQQLVRLTQKEVGNEQTYKRKIKELILSVELERSYSKQEILTGYLNTAPYGTVQYGVESATRDYFQKSAKNLTLDEAVFLAAIPQSPSYYSPYGPSYNPEDLVGRQHYILDLMEQQGMITAKDRDAAKKVNTLKKVKRPKPKFSGIKAPWFALTAKEYLENEFSADTVERGGWKVTTTVDLKLQEIAEKKVNEGMGQVRAQGGDVAAFAAEDVKTGQVVALVGGSDFTNGTYGQNNYARYRLPPGSSFKPYDYLALIEKKDNFGAGSVLYDTQGPLTGYACTSKGLPPPRGTGNCLWDYDFRYPGPMTLRYALGGSRNVPAIKAMLTVGVNETIKVADSLGLASGYKCYEKGKALTPENEAPCYASSAIGDGAYLRLDEHVHAYGTISRNGLKLPHTYILKIEDAAGKVLREWEQPKGEQVVREDSAFIVQDMMSDPNASYFPFGRKPHRFQGNKGTWKFAMKTGTTNDAKDGWMMGFSSRYAAGVWVGYHNRQVEMSGTMENMTQPIWQEWMQEAHRDLKPEDWKKPAGVQSLPAFVVRSHVGIGSVEPSPANDLFPSWFKKKAVSNKRQTIDVVSNKLATDCTPARARKDIVGGDASSFSADQFVTGSTGAVNTSQRDNIHKCSDRKPTVRLEVSSAGGNKYRFTADVTQGTHAFSSSRFPGTIGFAVDGQNVHSQRVDSSGTLSYIYTAKSGGSHTVNVTLIDSVLYDSKDSATFTSAGGGGSLTITGANFGGGQTTFSWSGGSGTVTIYDEDDDVICTGGGSSCSHSGSFHTKTVYAKDEDDAESTPFNVP